MEGKGKRTIRRFECSKRQNFRKAVLVLVRVVLVLVRLDELLSGWELVWVQLVLEWWGKGSCCHRHYRHRKGGRHRCCYYQWQCLRWVECTGQVVH
jgi:hypothetical protein